MKKKGRRKRRKNALNTNIKRENIKGLKKKNRILKKEIKDAIERKIMTFYNNHFWKIGEQ